MKKVYQTIFGKGEGNCLSACIASILELRIDQVPNFCALYDEKWIMYLAKWLKHLCLSAVPIKAKEESILALLKTELFRDCYIIVSGKCKKCGIGHAVVYKGDTMIHNPGKDEDGDIELEDILIIFPMNPGRWV